MPIGSVQARTTALISQPATAAKTSSLAYYHPADANKDGVVSAAEALAYALRHPELGVHKAASAAATHRAQTSVSHLPPDYTQRATTSRSTLSQHGRLDLKA